MTFLGTMHDRKAAKQVHCQTRAYDSTCICSRDLACYPNKKARGWGIGHLNFGDFSKSALWRSSETSHEASVAAGDDHSPFSVIPNNHTGARFPDILHDGYQGHIEDLCASVVGDIISSGDLTTAFGVQCRSVQEACDELELRLKKYLKRHGLQRGSLQVPYIILYNFH